MKESTIQTSIMAYLNKVLKKGYFIRANAGKIKLSSGRFMQLAPAGCPDIIGCYKGRFIGLEVKTKSGRQSHSQILAQGIITDNGGYYFIVRSISDVKECFERIS